MASIKDQEECEHEWDGPNIELTGIHAPGWTVTCSKCGIDFFTVFQKENEGKDAK